VILAAGVLKLPSLASPAGAHIQGLVLLGAVLAGLASYVSVNG
jgi:undecaprenyl-diphosphatase